MNEILGRCGYRCDLCLAYKPNVKRDDRRQELSDGWEKCFGFRIPPEDICCDGCLAPDTAKRIDSSCPVRPCVLQRGISNCSECEEFPCDRFREREVVFRKIFAARPDITETDRARFILPYENRARLDAIRRSSRSTP